MGIRTAITEERADLHPLPGFISTKEAAEILNITLARLGYLRLRGRGPRYEQLDTSGGNIWYLKEDVEAYKKEEERKDLMMTTDEAAEYLGIKPHSLSNLRLRGKGPAFIQNDHWEQVFYEREDIVNFKKRRDMALNQDSESV